MISKTLRTFLALHLLLSAFAIAAEETPPPAWNGFEKIDATVAGRKGFIVKPKTDAPGKPWIWRTEFFGHEPQADLALLAAGWHLAYYPVPDMYGTPKAIVLMESFHHHLVHTFGLAQRATLEGFSRGGLYAVNFAAAYPAKTAALYLDAPVLDIRSWPGGKGKGKGDPACWRQALMLYRLTEDTSQNFKGNPINQAELLAKAGIPIIAVCGDADDVVPFNENTGPFAEKYRAAGGKIEVITKPGVNHHPHSLKDPAPIVTFLIKEALK